MEILNTRISLTELKRKYLNYFKGMIKAVADVKKEIIALEVELHSDLELYLLEQCSKQEDLWDINIYPDKSRDEFIEYSALINIRSAQENYSMEIENDKLRKKISQIVHKLINYET